MLNAAASFQTLVAPRRFPSPEPFATNALVLRAPSPAQPNMERLALEGPAPEYQLPHCLLIKSFKLETTKTKYPTAHIATTISNWTCKHIDIDTPVSETKTRRGDTFTTTLKYTLDTHISVTVTIQSVCSIVTFDKEIKEFVQWQSHTLYTSGGAGFKMEVEILSSQAMVGKWELQGPHAAGNAVTSLNDFCKDQGINTDEVWKTWGDIVIDGNQKVEGVFNGVKLTATFYGSKNVKFVMSKENGIEKFYAPPPATLFAGELRINAVIASLHED
jgi:hypothetical protein